MNEEEKITTTADTQPAAPKRRGRPRKVQPTAENNELPLQEKKEEIKNDNTPSETASAATVQESVSLIEKVKKDVRKSKKTAPEDTIQTIPETPQETTPQESIPQPETAAVPPADNSPAEPAPAVENHPHEDVQFNQNERKNNFRNDRFKNNNRNNNNKSK